MSPEQVRGIPVDFRADIFSLGVLLFEMVTGQSPFRRENFLDSLHAVAFDETPPMNSIRAPIPEELQRIVSRCLRKRPEDRHPNARLLVEELRLLRRNTEAGVAYQTTWRKRMVDAWNRKLYWGQPMTVSILHDVSPEQLRKMLAGAGVQYVRDDAIEVG